MASDFSITGDTKLDTSGVTNGISSMTVAAGNLISDLVKTAGSKMAELVTSSVDIGAAFETSLAKVNTIADTSVVSVDKLQKQILDTSSSMGIAASDIAEAAYQAISAGQDTSNAVVFAGQASKLAAAGFTSSSAAVDILTTALNAYGMSAEQATHVSDVLLTTQNLGKTSVDELSSSMGRVIPLAAAYGVSVENLSSSLAVMTANGIATAEATTYTKSMLNELGDAGSAVGKILQQQTGKSFAQLNADGKSLGDVLQILYDSVDGDSTAFAGLWSSVEAGTGALSLASGGADKFNGVLAQMVDSAGATETAYETMTGTFQHNMESLQTAASNLSIQLFDSLNDNLSEAAQWGTDCISTLTTALSEGGTEAMLDAASSILEDLTAGIVRAIPGLASAATQTITQLVQYLADHQDAIFDAGLELLEQLIIGITDNLPSLITAAAELIAKFSAALLSHLPDLLKCGAALLTTLVDGILRSIENLGEAALACVAKLLGVWDGNMAEFGHIGENIVSGLLNGIKNAWSRLLSGVKSLVSGMVGTVKNLLGIHSPSKVFSEIGLNVCRGLAEGLTKNDKLVKDAAKTVVASVTDTAKSIQDGVTRTVETTTEMMADGTTQQVQTITETGKQLIDGVEKTVKTVTKISADGKKTISQTMEDVEATVEKTVTDTRTALVNGVKTTTQTVTETLTDGTKKQKQVITETYNDVVDGALVTIERVKTLAADGTEQVAETIKAASADSFDGLWKELQDRANTGVLGTFSSLYTAVKNEDWAGVGEWVAATLYNGLTANQKQQIESFGLGLIDQLNGVLKNAQTQLASAAWELGSQICSGVTNGFSEILSQAKILGGTLTQILTGLKAPLSSAALAISEGLKGGLLSAIPAIYAGMGTLIGSVGAAFEGMLTAISTALNATVFGVPMGVIVAGAAVALGVAIAAIVARLGGRKGSTSTPSGGGSTSTPSGGGSSGGISGDIDISTGTGSLKDTIKDNTGSLEDTIKDNTAALTKTNAALADMVRQANALVLSDTMHTGSTVAASGTAQIAAAANNYHREGDTTINQYIQSKAQSAADLARETRWEADKARRQRRG